MFRAMALLAYLVTLVLGLTFPARLSADAKEEKQKQLAEQATKFEYPAGKRIWNFNIGTAYESVASTPDDLDAVDNFYRKALSIQPVYGTGVSSITKLIVAGTPKERGIDVLQGLYINDLKLKDDDPTQRVPQTATVRSYVVKEEKYTLVVVATRTKDEKATQISVTFIPESSK